MAKNIARDGAAKRTQTEAPAHPGMMHTAQTPVGNITVGGVSKTEMQRILGSDQIGEVHGGGQTTTVTLKEGHKGTPPARHPAMVSQRQRAASMDNGGTVLGQAILSGSTQIPPAINATIDDGKPARLPDRPK
jgi:hypothetical protein